ncbi:RimK/LysX family protein [Candidatus Saccharibacteria bacterium]|nr:RimK/LysX family protein [Candidatus Saccharibacteria bacterium]
MKEKSVIGDSALVNIYGRKKVPAKIDSGADASSIWASHISIDKKNTLKFSLFGPKSPFYSGKIIKRTDFDVAVVRSAMGQEQIRYRTKLPIKIEGRRMRVLFSLSNRSKQNFPILLGKRTLAGKFIIDVNRQTMRFPKNPRTKKLQKELAQNPYAFHQKYAKTTEKDGTK